MSMSDRRLSDEVIAPFKRQFEAFMAGRDPTRPASSPNDKQVAGTHYKDMGVQPWAVVDTWPIEQQIGYYRASALKYVMRLGTKDAQLQEARKAGHYIEKLIEVLEHAGP